MLVARGRPTFLEETAGEYLFSVLYGVAETRCCISWIRVVVRSMAWSNYFAHDIRGTWDSAAFVV